MAAREGTQGQLILTVETMDADNRGETVVSIEPRRSNGQFGPGNAGGGRKAISARVRAILEDATEDAAHCLVDGLDAEKVGPGGIMTPDLRERRECAMAIFDRLYGKPPVAIAVDSDADGNGGRPVGLIFIPVNGGQP